MTAAVRTAPTYRLATRRTWYRKVGAVLKAKLPRARLRPRPRVARNSKIRTVRSSRRGPPRLADRRAV